MTYTDWAKKTGISANTISIRINKLKWSVEKTLTTPVKRKTPRPLRREVEDFVTA